MINVCARAGAELREPRSRHPSANTCNGRPVSELLDLLSAGMTRRQIAAVFGVHFSTISAHASRHGAGCRRNLPRSEKAARVDVLKAMIEEPLSRQKLRAFAVQHRALFSAAELGAALGVSRCAIIGIWYRARAAA